MGKLYTSSLMLPVHRVITGLLMEPATPSLIISQKLSALFAVNNQNKKLVKFL